MADRRPRFRMRPVDEDSVVVVEERLVRRSHRHRMWLRGMARTRRWARRFRRSILLTIALLIAAVLAVAQTGRGQGIALDVALGQLQGALAGDLAIGGVRSGTLFSGATLTDVELVTSDGRPFLTADSVVLRYSIPAAVIGGPPIRSTIIWGLDLEISKYTSEQPINLARLVVPGDARPDSVPDRPARRGDQRRSMRLMASRSSLRRGRRW